MKAGDKNRIFIESSWHPKKRSLKCWERTTLPVFDENGKRCLFLLMVEDGNTESAHCERKALLTDNRSLLLGSFCSASKMKKGLSNKSLIPLPHSGKCSHVPINMFCFLSSGFQMNFPSDRRRATRDVSLHERDLLDFLLFPLAGEVYVLLRAVEFALCRLALQRARVLHLGHADLIPGSNNTSSWTDPSQNLVLLRTLFTC